MKLKYIQNVMSAIAMFALIAPAHAEDWNKIRIATEGAYAPWNFVEASGKLNGYDIDVSNDLCKRMKADCSIVSQDWDGIIPALNAGKYDAIVAAMVITPKRQEQVDFTVPYAKGARTFIALKGSELAAVPAQDATYSLASQDDKVRQTLDMLKPKLQGKVVGAQTSTTHVKFLEEYLKGVVEVREYKSAEAMILDLNSGRIDAAFDGIAFLGGLLGTPDGERLTFVGPRFDDGIFGVGSAIAIRKSDPGLKAKFDEAINAAIDDGTLKTLSMKWFKLDISPKR